jgi:hypothetical protein
MTRKPLVEESLIANLVPDPADVPDVKVHVGFLGKSSREGYWRLYMSPQMNDFIEVREEDIVHAKQFDAAHSPWGGTVTWIRADAKLTRTKTGARDIQTDFLRGGITRSRLPGVSDVHPDMPWWTFTITSLACVIIISTVCTVDCGVSGTYCP